MEKSYEKAEPSGSDEANEEEDNMSRSMKRGKRRRTYLAHALLAHDDDLESVLLALSHTGPTRAWSLWFAHLVAHLSINKINTLNRSSSFFFTLQKVILSTNLTMHQLFSDPPKFRERRVTKVISKNGKRFGKTIWCLVVAGNYRD